MTLKRNTSQKVSINMEIEISNADELWRSASMVAKSYSNMTNSDVFETIGYMEDPNVEDCISMIMQLEKFGQSGLKVSGYRCEYIDPR